MPDITMCKGQGCKLRDTCYRYRAWPNTHIQSYFLNPPVKDDECEWYESIEGRFPPSLRPIKDISFSFWDEGCDVSFKETP